MAGYNRHSGVCSPWGDTVDYKGGEVLKSCFSEFSLNPLVAPHKEGHSHSLIKAGE